MTTIDKADRPGTSSVPEDGQERRLSIAEALREAIAEEMRRDPAVFLIGEDIGVDGGFGGAFGVYLGLTEDLATNALSIPPSARR